MKPFVYLNGNVSSVDVVVVTAEVVEATVWRVAPTAVAATAREERRGVVTGGDDESDKPPKSSDDTCCALAVVLVVGLEGLIISDKSFARLVTLRDDVRSCVWGLSGANNSMSSSESVSGSLPAVVRLKGAKIAVRVVSRREWKVSGMLVVGDVDVCASEVSGMVVLVKVSDGSSLLSSTVFSICVPMHDGAVALHSRWRRRSQMRQVSSVARMGRLQMGQGVGRR